MTDNAIEAAWIALEDRCTASAKQTPRKPAERIVLFSKDDLRAAIAAYEQASWRPVDEAPKDGTPLFVCSEESRRAYIARWNHEFDSWTDEYGGFDGEICTLTVTGCWETSHAWFQPNEVAHYRPLPPPPDSTK